MIYSIIDIEAPKYYHNTDEYIKYLQEQVNFWKAKPNEQKEKSKPKKTWFKRLLKKRM